MVNIRPKGMALIIGLTILKIIDEIFAYIKYYLYLCKVKINNKNNMAQNITFITEIKAKLNATESLKNHIVEIKEDTERDELTLILKPMHDVTSPGEFIRIMQFCSCDLLSTYNNNLVIRLF